MRDGYSAPPKSTRTWVVGVVVTFALLAASMLAGASPASAATLNNGFTKLYFNYTTAGVNYVNLDAGAGKTDGSKVLWKNVATVQGVGIDALVTTNLTADTVVSNYGDAPQGVAGDFRVRMTIPTNGGYGGFTFAFFTAGTYGTSGQQQNTLTNVQVTGKDIDISQFNAFDGVSGYSLSTPTRLTVTKTPTNGWPANIVAQSPSPGGNDNPRDQAVASYASVTSTQIRMGTPSTSGAAGFALTWEAQAFTPLGSTSQGDSATVNYDLNNGAGVVPSSVTGTFGSTSGTVAYGSGFSRAGFIFTGWNTSAAGSGIAYPPGSALVLPAGTTTLYAQWVVDSTPYPITYFANGAGSGTVPAAGSYAGGSPYTIVGNTGTLARTGYTFGGWNSRADGTGTTYAGGASYSTSATLNLYAVWSQNSYNIDYSGNGSTAGTDPVTGTLTPPGTYTILTNPYSRTGYSKDGWNTAADGSGTNYATGAVYSTAANLLLYSKWNADSYSVTYFGNANTSGSAPATGSYTSGTPYTVSANTGGLVKSGAAFTGWNTAANGLGTSYPAGSSYTAITGVPLALYAQYAALRWAITYNGNGSGSGTVPAAGTYTTGGAAYTVANNTGSLARSGYTFTGWNTAADGSGTPYPAASSYTTSANTTLYAQWSPVTYNLTYNGNGSTGGSVPGVGTYTSGNSPYVVVDNTGTLTRTGYVFTGWNTMVSGLGVPLVPGATYVPTADQTLYAQWVPTTYVISYNGNGATAGGVPPNGGYTSGGSAYTVLGNTGSPALTRPGYTFGGWNSLQDGSGTPYGPGTANLTYSSTADLTLYAQWAPNPSYAITYNQGTATAGDVPAAGSYLDGGAAYTVVGNTGTPAALSRPGYTFANWTTSPSGIGGTPYGPGTANTSYSTALALSLYPQWTADTYVISYLPNSADSGNVPSNGSFTTDGAPYTVVGNTGAPVLARAGFTFTGWNTAANGSGTAYGPLTLNPIYSGLANLALYARWTANASYAITYNQGTATAGNPPAAGSYTDGGAAYTVLGNTGTAPVLTRPGFTFANWTTDPSGVAGTPYGPGTANPTYATAAGLSLYPQWTANASYAITYNVGSSPGVTGNPPAAGSYTDGGAAYTVLGNTGTVPVLARPGYTFANWTTDPTGVAGTAYGPGTANTTYATAAALSLYPQWTPWATMSIHVNSDGFGENYDGVAVAVSKDGGPFTYKTGTTDVNGNWDAGSIEPNATYQVQLTAPCDSHPVELKNPVVWETGAYAPILTLAATVPCAPVLSYTAAAGADTMSWTAPNDGGSTVQYFTMHYNTPARLGTLPAALPWGLFARYWPANSLSVPFATYADSGCPGKGIPAYAIAPQCGRGIGSVLYATPYSWRVAARNSVLTAGVLNPTMGSGWGMWSNTLPISRGSATMQAFRPISGGISRTVGAPDQSGLMAKPIVKPKPAVKPKPIVKPKPVVKGR